MDATITPAHSSWVDELCRLLSVPSPSSIRWAHAVNTLPFLHSVLSCSPPFHFIEADVTYNSTTQLPSMAHNTTDPHTDVSQYFTTLFSNPPDPSQLPRPLGLKLDFKHIDAVEPTLRILSSLRPASHSPIDCLLWLNADILPGPLGSSAAVPALPFITVCRRYFPSAVLSFGWTTGLPPPSSPPPSPPLYTSDQLHAMSSLCSTHHLSSLTFPVRARYVQQSWERLKELLAGEDGWSLTVWSNAQDGLEQGEEERRVETEWMQRHLPMGRVFLDLV